MAVEKPQLHTCAFQQLCSGVAGAEGPVFSKDGTFYAVAPFVQEADKFAGQILRVASTGEKDLLCAPAVDGHGGVPAGCQVDSEDTLWVADMRLGLLRVSLQDGSHTQEPFGSFYCYTAEKQMVKVDTGFLFSNGIAVQHDVTGTPRTVIVAETGRKSLWAYDITGPGTVTNKRLWGKLPGEHEGGPDGMDFDEQGRLLVANWGGGHIEVFGPGGGEPTERIKCPFLKVSNVHFEPNSCTVYVTEHDNDAIWRFQWTAKGAQQLCDRS